MLPVSDQAPEAGSKISALESNRSALPPATKTLPSLRSVAVWPTRGADILPVTDQAQSAWARIAAGRLKVAKLAAKTAVAIKEKLVFLRDCIWGMFIVCLQACKDRT